MLLERQSFPTNVIINTAIKFSFEQVPDGMPELHIVLHECKITLVKNNAGRQPRFFSFLFFSLFKIALLISLRSYQYLDEKSQNLKSLDINDTYRHLRAKTIGVAPRQLKIPKMLPQSTLHPTPFTNTCTYATQCSASSARWSSYRIIYLFCKHNNLIWI